MNDGARRLGAAADAALAAMSAPDEWSGYRAAHDVLAAVPAGDLLAVAALLAVESARGADVLLAMVIQAEGGSYL